MTIFLTVQNISKCETSLSLKYCHFIKKIDFKLKLIDYF